ncbi:MAG: LysM domain-containing protein, partial [Arenimonas sp.]
ESNNDSTNDNFLTTTTGVAAETVSAEIHGGSHEVKNGDTLSSVAKRYGLSLMSLRKLNGLSTKAILRVGQTLKLSP